MRIKENKRKTKPKNKKPRNIRPTRQEETGSVWDGLVSEKFHEGKGKTKAILCLLLVLVSLTCESVIVLIFNIVILFQILYLYDNKTRFESKTVISYQLKKKVKSMHELLISLNMWGLGTVNSQILCPRSYQCAAFNWRITWILTTVYATSGIFPVTWV